jgi:hypothetical protein
LSFKQRQTKNPSDSLINQELGQQDFIKPPGFSQSKGIVKIFLPGKKKHKKRNFLYLNLISSTFLGVLDILFGFFSQYLDKKICSDHNLMTNCLPENSSPLFLLMTHFHTSLACHSFHQFS